MYYVDSQRTLTRRDSSLVLHKKPNDERWRYDDAPSTNRTMSVAPLTSESSASLVVRQRGTVQRELVTMMFEAMLDTIVVSWEVVTPPKQDDYSGFDRMSDLVIGKRKKSIKTSKGKKSRSRMDIDDGSQVDSLQQCWWSAPDERAVICFKNGNKYEGNISMKCMHGEGRYQWADGTVYLGQFKENEMNGLGTIFWKDDSWYQGGFSGNLRHGQGLYVDSRTQRSYAGGWYCATKHGRGVIYYSNDFKNSYDGDWVFNVRHGYGRREYCHNSGYEGEWDSFVRQGNGLMIWPNHDLYKGEWNNGVMSGKGTYIWDVCFNGSMSAPSLNEYRGSWETGQRNGYGLLRFGLGFGSHYKGEFKNNRKHGVGKLVTNTGIMIQDKSLFVDDNLHHASTPDVDSGQTEIPRFNLSEETIPLLYHVDLALQNIDNQLEIRTLLINEFLENNTLKKRPRTVCSSVNQHEPSKTSIIRSVQDIIEFEEISLRNALQCYEHQLKDIYYMYATICNREQINFRPVLIRLYLWQLYFDCNIHANGLTLVEIDKMFHRNPQWLSCSPHNPYQMIYFWQFQHSLICVASKLYAKRELPIRKPDTILANAFRTFMERDVLPGVAHHKGRLVNGYGSIMPMSALYHLYCSVGEPHTVRTFLREVRYPAHDIDRPQPPVLELPYESLQMGENEYILEDDLVYVTDLTREQELFTMHNPDFHDQLVKPEDLKLFNFGNLSSTAIIDIFGQIYPKLKINGKVSNLEIENTFFEFFEAFVACAEESIKIKMEESQWREKFSSSFY